MDMTKQVLTLATVTLALWLTIGCAHALAATEKLLDMTLFQSTPENYRWSEGSTINLDGKDHLLMAVTLFGAGGHDSKPARILELHSRDGGLTWTPLEGAKAL